MPASFTPATEAGLQLGRVGITASANFTPVNAAYGAGSIFDVAKEFAFTYCETGLSVPSGSLIRILATVMRIDVTALQASEGAYSLYLYGVTPPSAQADAATWTLASADLPYYKNVLSIGTPVDLGSALYIKAAQAEDMKLDGTSFFGRLVTTPAFTPTAVARQITLHAVIL